MKNNQPKLIKNQPIGEDKFEGQAQENIANAVVKMLEENSCQMIGIDGGWGTGKSNLVGIVEKKLKNSSKGPFYVFTYDAWGHQGDLHRKVILQELIDFFTISNNLFDSDVWAEQLKKLTGTSFERKTKNIPHLSFGIILSFFLLISIPIYNVVTSQYNIAFWAQILFATLPFLLIIAAITIKMFKNFKRNSKKDNKENNSKKKSLIDKESIREACVELISVYKNKEIEMTTTEYQHETNPSVYDFRKFIHDVSLELKENRLILVFDNFDRLPRNQVKELWATIHTLFADTVRLSNISVIIPFDRTHIISAFRDEDIDSANNEVEKTTNTKKVCYGNDFINKTFDIVFRVSAPILSDWEQFFKEKWIYAFGEINQGNETEYNAVVQIYDLLTKNITPREIVAFINECVSIRIAQREVIPFRYIALFIKGKDVIIKNPIQEITTPSYLEAVAFLYQNDNNLPKYISALFYQVDSSKALDVAYKKALKDALESNDNKVVAQISESKSFYSILKNTINEVANIENLILALENIPQESFLSLSNSETIWTCVFKKAEVKTDGRPGLQNYQRALLNKITLAEKERYTRKLFNGFTSSSEFNAVTYSNNIKTIDSILKPFNIDVYSYLQHKRVELNDFISLLNSPNENPSKFHISCNPDDIDNALEGKTIEQLKDVSYVPKIVGDYGLPKYKAKLLQFLPTALPNISHLEIVIGRLKEVQKTIPVTAIPDPHIRNHFVNTGANSIIYPDMIAMRIAKQSDFQPQLAPVFEEILKSTDETLIDKITLCILFYIQFEKLLNGLANFGQYSLYRGIVQKLIESPSNAQVENVEPLLSNFEIICLKGDISPDLLMNFLNSKETLDFKPTSVPASVPIYLIKNTLQNKSALSKHCQRLVREYLSGMDEEKWVSAFSNINSYEVQASLLLNVKWTTVHHSAFKKTLKKVANGEIVISKKEQWDELIQSFVEQKNMESAFNDVTDALCNSSKDLSNDMFAFLAPWLFKYSSSLINRKEVLRKIFPSTILTDERCLNILNLNSEKMLRIIASAGSESYDFKDALINQAKEENPLSRQLAASLQFEISEEPDESEENESEENDNQTTQEK